MYSCDISSLYISIPTELGIEVVSYWLHKKRELIPQWFTNDFIMESLKFVLKNNKALFDDHMYIQLVGTEMSAKCAPSYAYLTVRCLEKTKLFTCKIPKYFNECEWKLNMEQLKRYMDDCFIFWPLNLNFENFKTFE